MTFFQNSLSKQMQRKIFQSHVYQDDETLLVSTHFIVSFFPKRLFPAKRKE
uniref:Uncharacterized protein n=1 Tax=Anguilla anguilla TaxID=7936 RepID=A0A0E9UCH6_ANGAN